MARRFIYEAPTLFEAGAVGTPGARAFYLRAGEGTARTSVAVEKVQVAALADRLVELLQTVQAVDANAAAGIIVPAPDAPTDAPQNHAFRVGAMSLAWDADQGEVIIQALAVSDEGEEVDETRTDLLRVRLRPERALAFALRASALVAAGRPLCPYCGEPLEATGHFCPRSRAQLN